MPGAAIPARAATIAEASEPPKTLPVPLALPALRTAPLETSSAERAPRANEVPAVAAFEDPPHSTADAGTKHASQLQAEARALREARAALRAGQLSSALATLEASRQRFSAPELEQEREALLIELLFRSGQSHAAALRAKAFLERFPESPHAGQVQQFTSTR